MYGFLLPLSTMLDVIYHSQRGFLSLIAATTYGDALQRVLFRLVQNQGWGQLGRVGETLWGLLIRFLVFSCCSTNQSRSLDMWRIDKRRVKRFVVNYSRLSYLVKSCKLGRSFHCRLVFLLWSLKACSLKACIFAWSQWLNPLATHTHIQRERERERERERGIQ